MKNLTIAILTIIIAGFSYSCGDHSEKEHDHSHEKSSDKHEHKNESGVTLEDGQRWSANSETTEGINNMQEIMASFSEKDNVDAYHGLKESLEVEFELILTNCTMDGEAHEQLHNYLLPLKEMFEPFTSAELDKCQKSFNEVTTHLAEYSNYFE